MTRQYSIYLIWSNEDSSYVAKVSDLPGCMADGPTPEKALENVKQIINEWIEVANDLKRQIPGPLSKACLSQ